MSADLQESLIIAFWISFNAIIIFILLRFLIKPFLEILNEINNRSVLYLCAAPFLFFIAQEILLSIHHSSALQRYVNDFTAAFIIDIYRDYNIHN